MDHNLDIRWSCSTCSTMNQDNFSDHSNGKYQIMTNEKEKICCCPKNDTTMKYRRKLNLINITLCALIVILSRFDVVNCRKVHSVYNKRMREIRRPEPSAGVDLPIIDLIEHPDEKYNPPSSMINETYLLEKLGRNFDPKSMSIRDPVKTRTNFQDSFQMSYKKNKRGRVLPAGNLPNKIKKVNLRFITMPDGKRLKTKVSRKQNKKIQRLLWQYTYCPVVSYWRDLGIRFWPRWIKEGRCSHRRSCSVPPGMKCKPKKSTDKVLLRWHCQDWNHSNFCKWIPIRYPIVTECSCAC